MSTKTIAEFNKTEAGLAILEERYSLVPDCTTKDGYEDCRVGLAELRTTRTTLEKTRKNLNADDQERIKYRNKEAKRITGWIRALEDPMKAAKKAVDVEIERVKQAEIDAEKERVFEIQKKVSIIAAYGAKARTVVALKEAVEGAQAIDCTIGYAEFVEPAETAKNNVIAILSERLAAAEIEEEKAEKVKIEAEMVRKRALEIDRERKALAEERDAQRAREKEERDKINRKRVKIESQLKEFREAKAEQERTRMEAVQRVQAELDRIEEKKKKEAEEKEAAKQAELDRIEAELDRIEAERVAIEEKKLKEAEEEEAEKKRVEQMQLDWKAFLNDASILSSIAAHIQALCCDYILDSDEGKEVYSVVVQHLEKAYAAIVESDVVQSQKKK